MISRRKALYLGGAGAASLGAAPWLAALAQPSGTAALPAIFGQGVRKNAHSLTADSDDVVMYRTAVERMKALSDKNPLDPLGWAQHWAHHSFFCATSDFDRQIHYGWFFLPWHRAYLTNLEQRIRRLLNEPAFALPYWDWTTDPTIPGWYFGEDNALANTTRYQEPGDRLPGDFTSLGPSMRARNWRQFLGHERKRANDQIEGTLEQSAHNGVHNWIGGEMASFDGAGNDPIFQSHHGQVDRLWEVWRSNGGENPADPDWLDHMFWFYRWDGQRAPVRVGDLVSSERIGYTYDSLDYAETLTAANTPVLSSAGTVLGKIELDPMQIEALAQRDENLEYQRLFLTYERMSLPSQPYHHRLFFVEDRPGGKAHYVGTHNILPIPGITKGLERQVNSQVEIRSEALKRVR